MPGEDRQCVDRTMCATDLESIEARAWEDLAEAAQNAQSAFRYLALSTVAHGTEPHARMVVLRNSDSRLKTLEFHTDVRSPKWQQLVARPCATLLGFDPVKRLQLRVIGSVSLHGPDSDESVGAWACLNAWTQKSYSSAPPGVQQNRLIWSQTSGRGDRFRLTLSLRSRVRDLV